MKKILISATICCSTMLFAQSEASFPNISDYSSVSTPLTHIGALPDCNADVSSLPLIYQETVATYCNVKSGGPGKVNVLVNSKAKVSYKKRDGKFQDGSGMILHLQDLKLYFVTEYKNGKPLYGVYTENGKDVSNVKGSGLNPQDCRTCHTGYEAWCINGQCGAIK